jgi:hypothetical protein
VSRKRTHASGVFGRDVEPLVREVGLEEDPHEARVDLVAPSMMGPQPLEGGRERFGCEASRVRADA